ncbi:MAG: hypothetical protein JXA89_20420 [Anaerolineae bacterium]|nr:hypothetical protein [Anaerolineae bacterium]
MGQSEATEQGGHPVGGGWLKMLDEYGVQFLALDIESDRWLVKLVEVQPEWVVDLQDGESVLFVRTDAMQTAT